MILAVVLLTPFLTKASTECGAKASSVDALVCSDDTLRAADAEMTRLYQLLLPIKPAAESEQAAWVAAFRDACDNSSCLSQAYLDRIDQLEAQIAASGGNVSLPKATPAPVSGMPPGPPPKPRLKTSFDCSGALSRAAEITCTDDTLAAADLELDRLLSRLRDRRPELAASQETWIRRVRDACLDPDCISKAYLHRISELEAMETSAEVESAATVIAPASADDRSSRAPVDFAHDLVRSPIFWGVGVWLTILALGASRMVVVCFDGADLLWAIAPLVLAGLGLLVVNGLGAAPSDLSAGLNADQQIAAVVAAFAVTFAVLKNFEHATRFNNSLLVGIPIGLFRLTLLPVGALTVLVAFSETRTTKVNAKGIPVSRPRPVLQQLMILALLAGLFRSICNGEAVYARRGWDLPDR